MDAAFYREMETRFRALAETTIDPDVKAALIALAEENAVLAEQLETNDQI
jgi:hypothetical protein